MLNVINLVLGGALLIAGRKLFWLFVGAAGFITGIQLATRFFQGSGLAAIIVGLVILRLGPHHIIFPGWCIPDHSSFSFSTCNQWSDIHCPVSCGRFNARIYSTARKSAGSHCLITQECLATPDEDKTNASACVEAKR